MTHAPPRLRRAVPADAPAVADVYLRARRAAAGIPPMAHGEAEVRRWVAETLLPGHETWVAEQDGRPVGLLALDGEELEQLYVDPACQGQGLGAALVALAQSRRPQLGLWTFAANAGARRFYERHGFGVTGEPSSDNEEGAPAIRYRWRGRADVR